MEAILLESEIHCPTAFLRAEVGFALSSLQVFCPPLQRQRQGRTTCPDLQGPKWFRVRFGYRPGTAFPGVPGRVARDLSMMSNL